MFVRIGMNFQQVAPKSEICRFPKLGRRIAAILNQLALGPGVCKERSRIHKVFELRFPLD